MEEEAGAKERPTAVLLLEESGAFAGYFQTVFKRLGAEVDNATSEEECKKLLDTPPREYDFILANYNILRRDNHQVLHQLRRIPVILPVIAYDTTFPSDTSMERLHMMGIDNFVFPPFSDSDLRALISHWRREHFTEEPSKGTTKLAHRASQQYAHSAPTLAEDPTGLAADDHGDTRDDTQSIGDVLRSLEQKVSSLERAIHSGRVHFSRASRGSLADDAARRQSYYHARFSEEEPGAGGRGSIPHWRGGNGDWDDKENQTE